MIIWPQYIDKSLSVSEGRKVSKEYAVENPTLSDIERALKRMNIPREVEKDKSYPGNGMKNQEE